MSDALLIKSGVRLSTGIGQKLKEGCGVVGFKNDIFLEFVQYIKRTRGVHGGVQCISSSSWRYPMHCITIKLRIDGC